VKLTARDLREFGEGEEWGDGCVRRSDFPGRIWKPIPVKVESTPHLRAVITKNYLFMNPSFVHRGYGRAVFHHVESE